MKCLVLTTTLSVTLLVLLTLPIAVRAQSTEHQKHCGEGDGRSQQNNSQNVTYTFSVLHSFTGKPDGGHPFAGGVLDCAGNFYGTTSSGGTFDGGTVFKIDKHGNETVLYNFTGATDGGYPESGLVIDPAGNLYGTTAEGGSGTGVVFKLDRRGQETVLYAFTDFTDGPPRGTMVRDAAGNLYGITQLGGATSNGTVFKIDLTGKETVLHAFTGPDGSEPFGNLVIDSAGNLYGMTMDGGASSNCFAGCGVVFKVDADGHESVLHSFSGPDGGNPEAGLVMDSAGNLYGATTGGGASKQGAVFKLDKNGTETVLYSFTGAADGGAPIAAMALDGEGNLYGTTDSGGTPCGFPGCGVVFKVDKTGKETVLHAFTGNDGDQPLDMVRDSAGNLYGTTLEGGNQSCDIVFTSSCGVVFKLTASREGDSECEGGEGSQDNGRAKRDDPDCVRSDKDPPSGTVKSE